MQKNHRITFLLHPVYIYIYHSGTLVQAVLMATSHSYGNGQDSTPYRIQTPLHSGLRPRVEHVTQNLYKLVKRKHLGTSDILF